jgi:hypothetical protein
MTFTITDTDSDLASKLELEGFNTIVVTVTSVNGIKVRDLWALEIELGDVLNGDDAGVLQTVDGSTFICDVDDVPVSSDRDPQDILVTLR